MTRLALLRTSRPKPRPFEGDVKQNPTESCSNFWFEARSGHRSPVPAYPRHRRIEAIRQRIPAADL